MIKDYGHIFRHDPSWAEKSALVSRHCLDVSQLLSSLQISPTMATSPTVTYHSACSLQHGQKLHDEPKALLQKCGYNVVDVPEGHLCCGSAGTYSVTQPELATQLRDNKLNALEAGNPEVIVTANIGCQTHLASANRTPVRHWVEVVDAALV